MELLTEQARVCSTPKMGMLTWAGARVAQQQSSTDMTSRGQTTEHVQDVLS